MQISKKSPCFWSIKHWKYLSCLVTTENHQSNSVYLRINKIIYISNITAMIEKIKGFNPQLLQSTLAFSVQLIFSLATTQRVFVPTKKFLKFKTFSFSPKDHSVICCLRRSFYLKKKDAPSISIYESLSQGQWEKSLRGGKKVPFCA